MDLPECPAVVTDKFRVVMQADEPMLCKPCADDEGAEVCTSIYEIVRDAIELRRAEDVEV